MIDWFSLFANVLWIFGLALALAVLSYASWQASLIHDGLRSRLGHPGIQASLALAGVLFCAGLAATASHWWEIGLWGGLMAAFFIQIITVKRTNRPYQDK